MSAPFEGEQRRDLRPVGLKLLEGRVDRGVFVGWVLQLDDAERQSVDEQHDVGPPFMVVLEDGELIDGEPVVRARFVEVQHAHLGAANPTVCVGVLHSDAGDDHAMEVAVPGLQRRPGRAGQSVVGVVEGVVGYLGVEARESGSQAAVQNNLVVAGAFRGRRVGPDGWTVQDGPAERPEPVEGDSFDGRFRHECFGHGATPSSVVHADRCRVVNAHGRRFQSANSQLAGDKLWE